jgi:TPR repeat protein
VLDACRDLVGLVDDKRGAQIRAKLCNAGDKPSCDRVIELTAANDPKAAIAMATKQCDNGDDDQCGKIGRALIAGNDHIDADPQRGIALLTKSCDRGAAKRCTDLAEAYLDDTLPADNARVGDLLTRACNLGDRDGCFLLGKSLLASDTAKAVQIFTAECKHDERGCDALGDIYRVGAPGITPDDSKASKFYDTACQSGIMYACNKSKCMYRDQDACQKAWEAQTDDYYFRLGGAFDIK